ncbi:MAG TPA: DeoR/GlpR family DNA-binding transcription regulator [Gryllotalpicola sp.]
MRPMLADQELSESSTRAPRNRKVELLDLIRTHGHIEVSRASQLLGVSAETIRRDLRALEGEHLIRRRYGTAVPVESGVFESDLSYRETNGAEEKERIAHAAVERLGEAQTIFLDEGFQTQLVASLLPETRPLVVVTSSLPIANILVKRTNIQLIVLGGRVRNNTLGVVDHWAAEMLRGFAFDVAFIGANGVSVAAGLTTQDPAVAMVKECAVRVSARRIFVGAHHKFGLTTFVRFAQLDDFEVMLTGRELSQSRASQYASAGAQLVRV